MLLKKGSVEILRALRERGRSFTELKAVVPNSRTLSSLLRELSGKGLIKKTGRNYEISVKGEDFYLYLIKAINVLEEEFRLKNLDRIPHEAYIGLIKKYCNLLHETYGERLRAIAIFGSIARGTWNRDSDIDILIVNDGWDVKKGWERIIELQEVKKRLQLTPEFQELLEAGYSPAIQNYPLSIEDAPQFHRIYLDLCLDAIILYDKDEFLEKILSKFRAELEKRGARRVQLPNGNYYWILKEAAL